MAELESQFLERAYELLVELRNHNYKVAPVSQRRELRGT